MRIGVDVGGTLTDVMMVRQDGQAFVSKVTTTPHDPGEAVIAGIAAVLHDAQEDPRAIAEIVHGTAVASNTILQRRCAGPKLEEDGINRWRRVDLQKKISATFGVHMHERSVGKLLRRLVFRRISVRPRHPQADAVAQETRKKTLPRWSPTRSRSGRVASRSSFGGRTKRGSGSRAA